MHLLAFAWSWGLAGLTAWALTLGGAVLGVTALVRRVRRSRWSG